jgi:hypothetical protein
MNVGAATLQLHLLLLPLTISLTRTTHAHTLHQENTGFAFAPGENTSATSFLSSHYSNNLICKSLNRPNLDEHLPTNTTRHAHVLHFLESLHHAANPSILLSHTHMHRLATTDSTTQRADMHVYKMSRLMLTMIVWSLDPSGAYTVNLMCAKLWQRVMVAHFKDI